MWLPFLGFFIGLAVKTALGNIIIFIENVFAEKFNGRKKLGNICSHYILKCLSMVVVDERHMSEQHAYENKGH